MQSLAHGISGVGMQLPAKDAQILCIFHFAYKSKIFSTNSPRQNVSTQINSVWAESYI